MIRAFIICLVCLSLFLTPAHGDEVLVPVDDYPPWKITAGKSVAGGIDIALTNHLMEKIGIKPAYNVFPWKRCLSMMQSGSADFISGITRKKEREAYLYYLRPPYKTRSIKAFFVMKGSGQNYRELADFENKTVGLLRGAKYFEAFHNNTAIKKYEVNHELHGLKMVKAGRLDAFILTRENGEYLISKNVDLKMAIEKAHWAYDQKIEVYFAVSRNSKLYGKRHILEGELQKMVDTGIAARKIEDFFK